jgi:hypothetical protein
MDNIKNTNNKMYEFDKYDIIDFLESEYINDWLSIIPNDVWIINKKTIENQIFKLKDKTIILYIINKINLNLPKFIVCNFDKINLELLKFCVEYNFNGFKKQIKKNLNIYNEIIYKCITIHNYEFNKYFYEIIYFELEPEHKIKIKPNHMINSNDIHKDNMFYNSLKKILYIKSSDLYYSIYGYEIIKYYKFVFENLFDKLEKKRANKIFINIFIGSKIDNFNDMIYLKNILNITDIEFKKNCIFETSHNYIVGESVFRNICKESNMTFIFKVLNFCDDDFLLKNENIITLMTYISLSNKIENVFLVYNYLVFGKNYKFTKEQYSEIIYNIIKFGDKKVNEYKNIIIEFINLGGIISGYSIYTDYIERLKIKN